jgi:hypothetical protein
LAKNATTLSKNLIYTKAVHLKTPGEPISYAIKKTGYYCVGSTGYSPDGVEYTASVEFRNAYGELPAAQIAKLPFYGGIAIVYAVVGLYVKKNIGTFSTSASANESAVSGGSCISSIVMIFVRTSRPTQFPICLHVKVAVQNYITAIIIFLIIEMIMTWAFYGKHLCFLSECNVLTVLDYLNRNGSNVGSKALMIIVAILNAGRNSFSFFLLLIVCMGYGVVKPTLGKSMVYIRWLAGAHFVFGLIYSIASLTITPEHAGEFERFGF